MSASVTKTSAGYEVTIKDKTITLPSDSKMSEIPNEVMKIGTDKKRLEIDPYANTIVLVEDGQEEVIVPDEGDDEERADLVMALSNAWAESDQEGSSRRRSRVNRKTRRSKGKRGNTKRRKLRKLSSRRR
jgi:hypothetical protein